MNPPLFDDADQMATDGYHKKIQERLTAVTANPAHMTEFTGAWQEIGNAWLPLWGVAPPLERPGAREGGSGKGTDDQAVAAVETQNDDPGICRNAISSGVDGRPSVALRCG